MITLYSGTPGSGKSLHLAKDIAVKLSVQKKTVICNFPINIDYITRDGKRKIGNFIYRQNHEITVEYLQQHAHNNHKVGIEGQTLLVIDEAGIMFNSRDYGSFDRKGWINFFMTHRHYGYNVIMVSQSDRMIDRQIRAFIEYDVKHRKANNYKTIGLILTILHIPIFVAVTYWYGIRERCGSEFFVYRKRDAKLYDTMMMFGGEMHGKLIGNDTDLNKLDDNKDSDTAIVIENMTDNGDGGGAKRRGTHRRYRIRLSMCMPVISAILKRIWQLMNTPIHINIKGKKEKRNTINSGVLRSRK